MTDKPFTSPLPAGAKQDGRGSASRAAPGRRPDRPPMPGQMGPLPGVSGVLMTYIDQGLPAVNSLSGNSGQPNLKTPQRLETGIAPISDAKASTPPLPSSPSGAIPNGKQNFALAPGLRKALEDAAKVRAAKRKATDDEKPADRLNPALKIESSESRTAGNRQGEASANRLSKLQAIEMAMGRGAWRDALAQCEMALANDRNDSEIKLLLAIIALRLDQIEMARTLLQSVRQKMPLQPFSGYVSWHAVQILRAAREFHRLGFHRDAFDLMEDTVSLLFAALGSRPAKPSS